MISSARVVKGGTAHRKSCPKVGHRKPNLEEFIEFGRILTAVTTIVDNLNQNVVPKCSTFWYHLIPLQPMGRGLERLDLCYQVAHALASLTGITYIRLYRKGLEK